MMNWLDAIGDVVTGALLIVVPILPDSIDRHPVGVICLILFCVAVTLAVRYVLR
jgi:hypothetical protein